MYDELKRHYDFASWAGINTLPLKMLLWRYRLRGTELAGWAVHRARAIALPESGRFLPSVWQRPGRHRADALRVDAYECASREAAHETLVRLLGDFSAPGMHRHKDTELGDVSFGASTASAVLFARANLVFLMTNAGRVPMSVPALAHEIDSELVARPVPAATAFAQRAPSDAVQVALGTSMPIELVAVSTAGHRALAQPQLMDEAAGPQYKLFSESCELCVEDEVVRATPSLPGRHEVEICTLDPAGDWAQRVVAMQAVER